MKLICKINFIFLLIKKIQVKSIIYLNVPMSGIKMFVIKLFIKNEKLLKFYEKKEKIRAPEKASELSILVKNGAFKW